MHRVIIQYDQEPDAAAYDAHAEVCRKVPGAAFRHGKVFGSPFGAPPHAYYAEWEFADKAAFDAGLASPEFGATLAGSRRSRHRPSRVGRVRRARVSGDPVLVERDGRVGVVLLNRPQQLNALSGELIGALVAALEELDADPEIRAIVLGGNERAFAAGADINELAAGTPVSLYEGGRLSRWDAIRSVRTPIVAAVSGFCLGGGCELAMLCDLIVASETARFGQPEINLGVIPGAGGTQRLTRAVGKAVAMDMILTGRMLSAREALSFGLVARVVAREAWLDEAKRVAAEIAAKGPVAVRLAKEAVDAAFEAPLQAGIELERRSFFLARASEDSTEGLNAFLEKRPPDFRGRCRLAPRNPRWDRSLPPEAPLGELQTEEVYPWARRRRTAPPSARRTGSGGSSPYSRSSSSCP